MAGHPHLDRRLRRPRPAFRRNQSAFLFWLLAMAGLLAVTVLPAIMSPATAASAPVLLSRQNSTRAVALESVLQTAEPFSPSQNINFSLGTDGRTRVMLFANNLSLQAVKTLR